MTQRPFTIEEKRSALEAVLASETFARSEQLRNFLRYVCEMEIAKRGAEINEYLVGVDVLHRRTGYSPANDSSVRTRAYELRQKLDRYYSKESPDSHIRIDLPKGSYTPEFVSPAAPPVETNFEIPTPPVARFLRLTARRWSLLVALMVGTVLAFGAGALWMRIRAVPGADPIVREAWGPLAQPNANVLICVGSSLHMVVRPNWQEREDGPPRFPVSSEIYPIFRKQRPLKPGVELFMHPTDNAVAFGELKATVAATNTLRALGVSYQLLPERVAPVAALRGRNAILLGNAQNSNAAAQGFQRSAWKIDFEPSLNRMAIVKQTVADSGRQTLNSNTPPNDPAWNCGLITVLPSEGAANNGRLLIISGITSVGADAAMEYFASPTALRELRRRFRGEGFSGFPNSYQVVIKCRSRDTFLLSYDYATHQILQP